MYNHIRIQGCLLHHENIEEKYKQSEGWEKDMYEFATWLTSYQDTPFAFQSSGSTGKPKTVLFTKEDVLHSALRTNHYFNINAESHLLLSLPCKYVAGRMMIARAWVAGANLIFTNPTLCPEIPHLASGYDFAAFTPSQLQSLIFNKYEESILNIRQIILGGEPVSNQLYQDMSHFPNKIFLTYGMTETLSHVAIRQLRPERWLQFKSIHPDITFEQNTQQCLIIRDGLNRIETHDIVELTDKHHFQWIGRSDHIINSGGIKIHPEQLEECIISKNLLAENSFYISSKTDMLFGEVPILLSIVPIENTRMEEINNLFDAHQRIKGVIIQPAFRYTENGKLIRERF